MINIRNILNIRYSKELIFLRNTNVADIDNMEDVQNITWEEMDRL